MSSNSEDFKQFLETSRDFHNWLSHNDKITAYYEFALTAGTTALTGAGIYIGVESDPKAGIIIGGLFAYATKTIGQMGLKSLEMHKTNAEIAELRQKQIEDLSVNQELS